MNQQQARNLGREKSRAARRLRMQQRLALIEALPAHERTPRALAARFGIQPDTAVRFLRKRDRLDLLATPPPPPRRPKPVPEPRPTQGELLREEIAHLASFGWDVHEIARSLDRKPDSIRVHLRRHGMTDLLARIDRKAA